MKLHLSLFTLILLLTTSISHADDYVWGEEFKEGDIISAATFNQIFGTLQKLNRTPIDADLVGTWSCNAITTRNTDGWTNKGAFFQLENAQVTLTSSGSSSSIESPYAISTSAPSPFKRTSGAFSGVYSLFDNMIFTKISGETDSRIFLVDIKSETKIDFIFQETSAQSFPANYSSYISCNSAVAVPAAPTTTTATNAQTTVNVTWTDQSSDETGFKIYRRLSNATEATQLATAVTASPYVDSTITEGQTAYYSVSSYNANGESAKSKIVSATLDSVKPTVVSTTPTNGGSTTGTTVSVTFNEPIIFTCLAGNDPSDCNGTNDVLVTLVGNTPAGPYRIGSRGTTGITISSASAFVDGANASYTATVNSEFIYDLSGNKMAADYVFTFTDN
jgi:hypothetical protein